MTIREIEELSFADLKAQREAVTETAKQESADVLADRYIKALMDAKQRDEKLSEQGRTITALQDALEAAQAQAVSATQRGDAIAKERCSLITELEQLLGSARNAAIANKAAIEAAEHSLRQETARANRLKVEATRNHQAVAQAAKLLNDALAAQAVESADAG